MTKEETKKKKSTAKKSAAKKTPQKKATKSVKEVKVETEVIASETTTPKEVKRPSKQEIKDAKMVEKKAILNEKKKLEDQIDALVKEKKETKDKLKKKELSKEIDDLKRKRNNIGKRDTYLSDVRKEMRLVRWPSKEEVVKYSIACLIFVLYFALFFYGIDALFALVKDLID